MKILRALALLTIAFCALSTSHHTRTAPQPDALLTALLQTVERHTLVLAEVGSRTDTLSDVVRRLATAREEALAAYDLAIEDFGVLPTVKTRHRLRRHVEQTYRSVQAIEARLERHLGTRTRTLATAYASAVEVGVYRERYHVSHRELREALVDGDGRPHVFEGISVDSGEAFVQRTCDYLDYFELGLRSNEETDLLLIAQVEDLYEDLDELRGKVAVTAGLLRECLRTLSRGHQDHAA